MKDLQKEQAWIKKIADFQQSGLSQKAWCEKNNEALHQLSYWKERLKNDPIEFEELSLSSELKITHKTVQLQFSGSVDLNTLKTCLCSL